MYMCVLVCAWAHGCLCASVCAGARGQAEVSFLSSCSPWFLRQDLSPGPRARLLGQQAGKILSLCPQPENSSVYLHARLFPWTLDIEVRSLCLITVGSLLIGMSSRQKSGFEPLCVWQSSPSIVSFKNSRIAQRLRGVVCH